MTEYPDNAVPREMLWYNLEKSRHRPEWYETCLVCVALDRGDDKTRYDMAFGTYDRKRDAFYLSPSERYKDNPNKGLCWAHLPFPIEYVPNLPHHWR